MESIEQTNKNNLKELINLFRVYKKLLFSLFPGFLLAFILIIILLPSIYRSYSTILIEQQEIPQDLVRSTITTYADQRLQLIYQRVMTNKNLWEVIEKYDLYSKLRKKEPREVVLEEMRSNVDLEIISANVIDPRSGRPTQATIAFTVSYDNKSSSLAYKVSNELTSLFLNENLKNRTERALDASKFLSKEAERLEKSIKETEIKLGDFKQENVNRLPEMVQFNWQLMDRAERELDEIDRQIQVLKERKIYLNSELALLSPHETLYSETGERMMSKTDRLKVLQRELVRQRAKYSDDHPSVKRVLNEIETIELDLGSGSSQILLNELTVAENELDDLKSKYSDEHPEVIALEKTVQTIKSTLNDAKFSNNDNRKILEKPSNPSFIQLQSQLDATNTELSSLLRKRISIQNKISNVEQDISASPLIEKDYNALLRKLESDHHRFREIKAKLMDARLSESLEQGQKGEKFTLIEPPLQSERPVFPNRPILLFVSLILSTLLSIGIVALRNNIDSVIRSPNDISDVFNGTSIATIPHISTAEENQSSKFIKMKWLIGIGLLTLLFVLLIHFFYKPLDVLWYVILRKISLL